MDWEIPQTDLNRKKNLIWGQMPNGKIVKAKKIENLKNFTTQFEFILPTKISPGKSFTILIGSPEKNKEKINGNRCQIYTQRKRKFILRIGSGKGSFKESENFYLDVRGNIFENLRIITPSFVSKNKRFDVIVRFEDKYGNLTGYAKENTLIDLSYQNLRENLNWRLFVPETGFITLPNLYFNEPGTYRIQLKNLQSNAIFLSSPIRCFFDYNLNLFWGTFHGEAEEVDSKENIESCLRLFRDDKGFQFYATSSFDSIEETSNESWKNIAQNIAEFNEDYRFTSFLGFQWRGISKEEGVRQFIYLKDNKPLLRKKDLKTNSLKKIYKTTLPKDLLSIPMFTMSKKYSYDFKNYNPDFERVVEIYSAWGSSECTEKEGNKKPIKGNIIGEDKGGSIRLALHNNCRFGFVAGGLDDRGIYEDFYDSNQAQYTPGLTAIIVKNQTREELFSALHKRSCYATTGKRIILDFNIANQKMGSELTTLTKPGLLFNRYITGLVVGTDLIEKVEIIRNGEVFHTLTPKGDELEFDFNDDRPLEDICIIPKNNQYPFVYYYLRVFQRDKHMAWSSPIWVDIQENPPKK
jgi:hypothetical protein